MFPDANLISHYKDRDGTSLVIYTVAASETRMKRKILRTRPQTTGMRVRPSSVITFMTIISGLCSSHANEAQSADVELAAGTDFVQLLLILVFFVVLLRFFLWLLAILLLVLLH